MAKGLLSPQSGSEPPLKNSPRSTTQHFHLHFSGHSFPQMKLGSTIFQCGVLMPKQYRGLLLIKKWRTDLELRQLVKYSQVLLRRYRGQKSYVRLS